MGLWRFSQAETKLVAVIGGTVQVAPAAPQRDWLNSFSSSSRETAPPVHLNEQAGMVAPKPAEARVRSSSPHTFPLLRRPGSLLVQGTSPRPLSPSPSPRPRSPSPNLLPTPRVLQNCVNVANGVKPSLRTGSPHVSSRAASPPVPSQVPSPRPMASRPLMWQAPQPVPGGEASLGRMQAQPWHSWQPPRQQSPPRPRPEAPLQIQRPLPQFPQKPQLQATATAVTASPFVSPHCHGGPRLIATPMRRMPPSLATSQDTPRTQPRQTPRPIPTPQQIQAVTPLLAPVTPVQTQRGTVQPPFPPFIIAQHNLKTQIPCISLRAGTPTSRVPLHSQVVREQPPNGPSVLGDLTKDDRPSREGSSMPEKLGDEDRELARVPAPATPPTPLVPFAPSVPAWEKMTPRRVPQVQV
ncbi:unnamed protein product [Durusdinium trenchii]